MEASVVLVARWPSLAFVFFLNICKLIVSHFMRYFAFLWYFNESWPSPWSAITCRKPVFSPALSCIALSGILRVFLICLVEGGVVCFFSFLSSAQPFNNVPVVWHKFKSFCIYLEFHCCGHIHGRVETVTQLCLEFKQLFLEAPKERWVIRLYSPSKAQGLTSTREKMY